MVLSRFGSIPSIREPERLPLRTKECCGVFAQTGPNEGAHPMSDTDTFRLAHQRCDVDLDEYYRHAGILVCDLSADELRPSTGRLRHRVVPLVTAAVMTACVIASRASQTHRSPHRRQYRVR
jgi:hypothetical protein